MNKIYPKEWLQYHPYKTIDAVDRYYCKIVNRLIKVFYEFDVMAGNPMVKEGIYEETAVFIGAWFEDVISQTGIWQVFTSECEKRYGSRLPFYELNDGYFYDEINVEDIRFILWHCFQRRKIGATVYNPENIGLENLALEIYDLLDSEYETAPENERLQEFFNFSHLTENDFLEYRNKVEWFFMNCYINIGCYENYMNEMKEQIQDFEENKEGMDAATMSIVLYSHRVNTVLQARTPLLAITAPEYLKLILEHNQANHNAPYMNVQVMKETYYTVESEADEYFVFKSVTADKTEYKVRKESLDLKSKPFVLGDTLVSSTLYKYGEYWSHNGIMKDYCISKFPGMKDELEKFGSQSFLENGKRTYKDFIKATEGKRFVFFKNTEELLEFIEKKLKYKNASNVDFSSLRDGIVMLSATSKNGLCVMRDLCDCVASPDNPYYNQTKAEKNALSLLINKKSVPYELSCYLLDNGYLKDAGLNSTLGAEHGREFVRKNAQFFMDYFFNRCREKDYNEK